MTDLWRIIFGLLALLTLPTASCWAQVIAATPAPPKEVYNSQKPGEEPNTPQQAVQAMQVPEGFRVTLFAGEPDISQPVSMSTDDRGRLWVAECYTYAERGFDGDLRDRIIVLHDTNGDGQHDQRKIFWDQGNRLTSVLPGSQGCWILNHGTLAWLADADENDQADGEPVVFLDGFDHNQVGHNIVNGLMWGPDGWIYGRHGIQATSYVGRPGTPTAERTAMNCAIWRFHPQQQRFEVVTAGTTNPWGLDYDQHGEFFFTNNVIGHGWHVIPGAHYKRMYGADFNPHYYELIDQHADHYHWDHSASWTDSREDNGIHGRLGGGHSHCGGMIYLGDNWPDQYRNHLFMCNIHGRRVNQDIPVREGSGYVLKHGADMIFANNPWFRGVDLIYGPDGGVYLSDWTDLGECHDHDGVHRTSGRIYKITYGQPERHFQENLAEKNSLQLVEQHLAKNDWFVRHARRLLMDRQQTGDTLDGVEAALRKIATENPDLTRQLQALWTLHALGLLSEAEAVELLSTDNEHLRKWGLRFLANAQELTPATEQKLLAHAEQETSPFVRLGYASLLQKLPAETRLELARCLVKRAEDRQDHNLSLMIWYGLEPVLIAHSEAGMTILQESQLPLIRQFIARRFMHENKTHPEVVAQLVQRLQQSISSSSEAASQESAIEFQANLLRGMVEATRGWKNATPPANWAKTSQQLMTSSDRQIQELTRELSVVFGDGRAMEELTKIVLDTKATPIDREQALEILATSKADGVLPLLKKMVYDHALEETAARHLAAFDDPAIPQLLINTYRRFKRSAREAAVTTLCSRPASALLLLKTMEKQQIPELTLSATQARQIASMNQPELSQLLEQVWGTLRTSSTAKQARMAELKQQLTTEALSQADLAKGRLLYDQTCSNCHRLFDSGKELGPNLTGSNRDQLDYLLENLLDPSAVVPKQYQVSTVVLTSGRVLNGVIASQTDRTLTLQTEKEILPLDTEEIELIKPSELSLMPEGQTEKMTIEQIRDLIAYLQSPQQVAPAENVTDEP